MEDLMLRVWKDGLINKKLLLRTVQAEETERSLWTKINWLPKSPDLDITEHLGGIGWWEHWKSILRRMEAENI